MKFATNLLVDGIKNLQQLTDILTSNIQAQMNSVNQT